MAWAAPLPVEPATGEHRSSARTLRSLHERADGHSAGHLPWNYGRRWLPCLASPHNAEAWPPQHPPPARPNGAHRRRFHAQRSHHRCFLRNRRHHKLIHTQRQHRGPWNHRRSPDPRPRRRGLRPRLCLHQPLRLASGAACRFRRHRRHDPLYCRNRSHAEPSRLPLRGPGTQSSPRTPAPSKGSASSPSSPGNPYP